MFSLNGNGSNWVEFRLKFERGLELGSGSWLGWHGLGYHHKDRSTRISVCACVCVWFSESKGVKKKAEKQRGVFRGWGPAEPWLQPSIGWRRLYKSSPLLPASSLLTGALPLVVHIFLGPHQPP